MECPNCGNKDEFEEVGNTTRIIQCQGCQFKAQPADFDLSGMTDQEKLLNWIYKLKNNPDPHAIRDITHPIPSYVWGW